MVSKIVDYIRTYHMIWYHMLFVDLTYLWHVSFGVRYNIVVPGEVIKDEVTSWNSHPGAGAYSNYHRFHWIAKRDILPGEELFVAPGDEERKKWTELKSAKDYERTDEIVHELVAADLNLTEAQWIGEFQLIFCVWE